ncbi:glycosyltransferase family 2 protein [soil metagenome]
MHPELSIIICTYNRQKFIGACLACLGLQTLPANKWEAIIVDNNSTDETAAIVKTFIDEHPDLPFRYVFEVNKGLSFARNRGIAEARAEIITFIDDDAEAVTGFVETVLNFMNQHLEASGAGGRVLPKYSEREEPRWMNKYLAGFIGRVDHGGPIRKFEGALKYPIGCNMTYRKTYLLQAGGFNNQLTFRGDDKHIYFAVSKLNNNIFYLHDALVYHNIDAARLEFDNFKKLFLKTGNEEKIRIIAEKGSFSLEAKLVEYLAKFGFSLVLWILFTFKGQEIKGRYTMYSQWFTLIGFLQKQVFVR